MGAIFLVVTILWLVYYISLIYLCQKSLNDNEEQIKTIKGSPGTRLDLF